MEHITGLYGGTFDPPHLAHLVVASAFLAAFPTASLTVMPCLIPPHKTRSTGGASSEDRLTMARLCFGGLERTQVSSFELERGDTSYTYLTVQHIIKANPATKVCLIMGQDNLEIMEAWREFRYLLENCIIAVAVRGDEPISPVAEALAAKYGADIRFLKTQKSPLSSTAIRRQARLGLPLTGAVTAEVAEYIKRKGLYSQMQVSIPTAEITAYISTLSPRRLTHTYGVEKAAIMLAKNHYPSLDKRLVSAAALLHDCTKEYTAEQHAALAEEYGISFDPITAVNVKLQHAITGAAIAKNVFSLPEAAAAIAVHTTAAADMNGLEKIIYMADFIEENRKDELCLDVRKCYFAALAEDKETALDKALLYALKEGVKVLEDEGKTVHPSTLAAISFLQDKGI